MEENIPRRYTLETELTDYMPLPRALAGSGLPSTALLLYAALLDRGTLSRKNHYADESGWVYAIYPVEHLAQTFGISDTAVKRHLRELEDRGWISRQREEGGRASHIYLRLPASSIKEEKEGTKCTVQGKKMPPVTVQKVPTNNQYKQLKNNNYYQHREDESL